MIRIQPEHKAILSSEIGMLFYLKKWPQNIEYLRIIHIKRNENSIISECVA